MGNVLSVLESAAQVPTTLSATANVAQLHSATPQGLLLEISVVGMLLTLPPPAKLHKIRRREPFHVAVLLYTPLAASSAAQLVLVQLATMECAVLIRQPQHTLKLMYLTERVMEFLYN